MKTSDILIYPLGLSCPIGYSGVLGKNIKRSILGITIPSKLNIVLIALILVLSEYDDANSFPSAE